MTDRLDRIEAILDRMAQRQEENDLKMTKLTESQQKLTESNQVLQENMSALNISMTRFFEHSTVEISEFKAEFMAVERRLDQHLEEIERLWRYCFAQLDKGNGHNPDTELFE